MPQTITYRRCPNCQEICQASAFQRAQGPLHAPVSCSGAGAQRVALSARFWAFQLCSGRRSKDRLN